MYFMRTAEGLLFLLVLYVDDILMACQDATEVDRVMELLNRQYQIRDMGLPDQFLGVHIKQCEDGAIELAQSTYIDEVCMRFGMEVVRPSKVPMIGGTRLDRLDDELSPAEQKSMENVPYREAVGALLYLSRVSRPDIAFAVGQLSRHVSCPRKAHWDAAKYLIRYLAGTKGLVLRLEPSDDTGVCVISDSDFAGDRGDRKSTSGHVVRVFGNPVSWSSKKQTVVAKSSTTAEYIAADAAVEESLWINSMVCELNGVDVSATQVPVYIDNTSAMKRIKKHSSSGAQKIIDVRFHAIKDEFQKESIDLRYIPSPENQADMLTKALPSVLFNHLRTKCGVLPSKYGTMHTKSTD
jgi:Reverse transcriptase (RNA-dependent DNA polymerase)